MSANNLRQQIAAHEADAAYASDSDDEDFVPTAAPLDDDKDSGDDVDIDGEEVERLTSEAGGSVGSSYAQVDAAPTTRARAKDTAKDNKAYESIAKLIPNNIDELWSDFLSDAPVKPSLVKPKLPSSAPSASNNSKPSTSAPAITKPKTAKAPLVNPFDDVIDIFAGDIRSTDKPSSTMSTIAAVAKQQLVASATPAIPTFGSAAAGSNGEPPTKKSILSASRDSWNSFKDVTGIDPELASANRGQAGYIEQVEFLGRADHRQFEHERSARAHSRKHKPANS